MKPAPFDYVRPGSLDTTSTPFDRLGAERSDLYVYHVLPGSYTEVIEGLLPELRRRGMHVAAIIPVDLLGKAVNYTAIEAIANEFEIPLLCDAAESLVSLREDLP